MTQTLLQQEEPWLFPGVSECLPALFQQPLDLFCIAQARFSELWITLWPVLRGIRKWIKAFVWSDNWGQLSTWSLPLWACFLQHWPILALFAKWNRMQPPISKGLWHQKLWRNGFVFQLMEGFCRRLPVSYHLLFLITAEVSGKQKEAECIMLCILQSCTKN